MTRLTITGAGHWVPPTVLDNAFFERLGIESSADWILERVGIRERRTVMTQDDVLALRDGRLTPGELITQRRICTLAEMTRHPWIQARQRAKVDAHEIDTVICGTSVPDADIPASACRVAAELGIEAQAWDVNSACSSFVVNLHVARSMATAGLWQRGLIANPERYTCRLDYTDRRSCVLFGDGATVSIAEASQAPRPGLEVIDTIVASSPSGHAHVTIPYNGFFAQNGPAVQKFAITRTFQVARAMLERHHLEANDIGYFVGHQANLTMLLSAARRLGFSAAQHLYNVDRLGNQGAAGAPSVLAENWDRLFAAPSPTGSDLILVAVVGSGLTWGAALLRIQRAI